jgi:hypothetical protein
MPDAKRPVRAEPLPENETAVTVPLATTSTKLPVVKVPAAAVVPPITVPSIVPPLISTAPNWNVLVMSTTAAPDPAPSE